MSDLVTKVCAVMADVGAISKDRENPHFKYMYVSAEAVRAKVQKACVKHGLILRLTYSDETVSLTSATLKCTCAVSIDGSTWVVLGEGWGAGADKAEKASLKANTSAAKYALANAFCIALGDDPEADEETDRTPLSAPLRTHAYDECMQIRADDQAATAAKLAAGFVDHFQTLSHVDEVVEWLGANMAAIDALGEPGRKEVRLGTSEWVSAKKIEGINFDGYKELWNRERDKARGPRKGAKS